MPPRRPKFTAPPPLEKLFQTEPPNSPEAEMALLGACILDPKVIDTVFPILPPLDAFFQERHTIIWDALLQTRGDLIFLHEKLRDKQQLSDVGGSAYLQKLAYETPGTATANHFAKILADKAKLRRLITAAAATLRDAYTGTDKPADEICDAAMSAVMEVAKDAGLSRDVKLGDAARSVFEQLRAGKPQVWQTGIHCFDETFGGLPHGQVVCMLGTSNSGKTTLSLQMVFNIAAIDRVPVRVFSYEQPPDRIAATVLSQQAGMQMHRRLTRGIMPNAEEWTRLEGAEAEMDGADFEVCKESLTAEQIYHKCRLYKSHGVRIVVVDYIQALPWIPTIDQSETVQINQACSWLQRIARDLGITVLLVSQPTVESSRSASDSRAGSQPKPLRMSDAKGGQSIGMISDLAFSIFRPYIDLPKPSDDQLWEVDEWRSKVNQVQVICVKGKYEARGAVNLRFGPETMTFEDPSGQGYLPT
jgi:replicative DNA helicase